MPDFFIVAPIILIVSITMTMVGKGGGNFYVVILTLADISIHQAATTGQFILFSAALASMTIFQKNKVVSWHLAIMIGTFTSLSALAGGYFSHLFSGTSLKIVFAFMLFVAGVIMLIPVDGKDHAFKERHFGVWYFKTGDVKYVVNMWIALPVTILTGFGSGMVGVSGGSFLVPLMVLACGVPMHVAVGTSSTLIAATAFMGFTGHAIQGHFNPSWAIPLAIITIIGGIIGGRFAMNSRPKNLKQIFAYTNWIAAFIMIISVIRS